MSTIWQTRTDDKIGDTLHVHSISIRVGALCHCAMHNQVATMINDLRNIIPCDR